MLYDSHTHCAPFSEDARQTIAELLESADRQHLAGVCVTDHFDKDVFYQGREDIFDLDAYFLSLKPIQAARPAGAVPLFIGVEIGYLPHLDGYLADLVKSRPFDAVILSLHLLNGTDPYADPGIYQESKIKLYSNWLQAMTAMIRCCPDFDILGHFDYISRLGTYPDRKMRYAEMPAAFDAFLGTLAGTGKALEINIRTALKLRQAGYPDPDSWPDPDILHRFRELGGQYVTLGSDAHNPGEVGSLIAEGVTWLHRQDWRYLTHYENRQASLSE